jgi:hypothetical protein
VKAPRTIHDSHNLLQHIIGLPQYIIITKNEEPDSPVLSIISPLPICFFLFNMLPAIKLNNELLIQATKSHDIVSDGMLAPKLCSIDLPTSKAHP